MLARNIHIYIYTHTYIIYTKCIHISFTKCCQELLLEISSEASRRTELAWPPVHLEGLRPNTEPLGQRV